MSLIQQFQAISCLSDMLKNIIAKDYLSFSHCVKSDCFWSYSGPYFLAFVLNIRIGIPLSFRMRENTDHSNS